MGVEFRLSFAQPASTQKGFKARVRLYHFIARYTKDSLKSYRNWYNKKVLETKHYDQDPELFRIPIEFRIPATDPDESDLYQGYWVEYYNHKEYTSLEKLFTYNMNGTLKYRPLKLIANSNESREYMFFFCFFHLD